MKVIACRPVRVARLLAVAFLLISLVCGGVQAEETGHVHGAPLNSLPHWSLAYDSQLIRERLASAEGNSYQKPNTYEICQDVLTELNAGSDPRLNLTDFPRDAANQSGLSRIHWHTMNPARNPEIVMKILAYRYKDPEDSSSQDDGMRALTKSDFLPRFQERIGQGQILLQSADFDVDGDHLEDRVYRLGEKIEALPSEHNIWPAPFDVRIGSPGNWQYLAIIHRADGSETQFGLDWDQGGLGVHHRSLMGVFLYKGTGVFYHLYDSIRVVEFRALKQSDLCGFDFTPDDIRK